MNNNINSVWTFGKIGTIIIVKYTTIKLIRKITQEFQKDCSNTFCDIISFVRLTLTLKKRRRKKTEQIFFNSKRRTLSITTATASIVNIYSYRDICVKCLQFHSKQEEKENNMEIGTKIKL